METRLARERADLQEALRKNEARESRVDTVERLLGSVRRIDEATSLSSILEALVQGASAETSRVGVLLVDGDRLKVWGHRGFAQGTGPSDMPIGASGTLAAAIAMRQSSFVPPVIDVRANPTPVFMRVPVGFTGVVVPLVVGGDVVAVLYADDVDRSPTQEDAPIWIEEVELLARHASICLENVTSVRTVELLARPG
jgi:putative methionine-R-sulfoxide reductase with GAF domain